MAGPASTATARPPPGRGGRLVGRDRLGRLGRGGFVRYGYGRIIRRLGRPALARRSRISLMLGRFAMARPRLTGFRRRSLDIRNVKVTLCTSAGRKYYAIFAAPGSFRPSSCRKTSYDPTSRNGPDAFSSSGRRSRDLSRSGEDARDGGGQGMIGEDPVLPRRRTGRPEGRASSIA